MKGFLRVVLFLGTFLAVCGPAAAQTIDPTFAAPGVYQTAGTNASLLLPNGQRLLSGGFNRVNGQASYSLIRVNANGAPDPSFMAPLGDGPNVLQRTQSGKILIFSGGGLLFPVGGGYGFLHRLNADGSLDGSFSSINTQNGSAYTMQVQADDKILVGGNFTGFNGQAAAGLVRLLPDGTRDASFSVGTGANGAVSYTLQLPDGKILVAGNFSTFNGRNCHGLVRLLPSGQSDLTFYDAGLDAGTMVQAVTAQPDGRLLLAGRLYVDGNPNLRFLVRLLPDGSYDSSFTLPYFGGNRAGVGTAGTNLVRLQADGRILVGGAFTSVNSVPAYSLVRLQPDGEVDASFAPSHSVRSAVGSLEVHANNTISVSGLFNDYTPQKKSFLLLNSDGTEINTAWPLLQAPGSVTAAVTQADQKIVVAGRFDEIAGRAAVGLARLLPNGGGDNTFAAAAPARGDIYALVEQPDGKLLVAGALIEAGLSYYTRGVTRLLPDGAPDNTFSVGQGFSNPVKHLLLQPDGRMLAVGTFGSVNTLSTLGVARLLANGTPDASFRVNPPTVFIREPHAAVLQPDGKVVVSGFFNKFSGGTTFGLVRYRPDGSEDPTFANSTEFTNASGYVPLYGLALQADGKLLVGGEFSRYGSQDVRNLIRLQPSGQLDPSFAPDLSWRRLGEATVQAILIQPNGRLLTSGTIFSTNIGSTAPFMARFQPDGAPDASFSAPIFTDRTGPASISVQPSGAVLLYGYFARLRFGTAGPYVESPLVRIDAGNVL
ncbi:delta-60 repeat domain-containing protein, partial [Hymenobacter persicinus]